MKKPGFLARFFVIIIFLMFYIIFWKGLDSSNPGGDGLECLEAVDAGLACVKAGVVFSRWHFAWLDWILAGILEVGKFVDGYQASFVVAGGFHPVDAVFICAIDWLPVEFDEVVFVHGLNIWNGAEVGHAGVGFPAIADCCYAVKDCIIAIDADCVGIHVGRRLEVLGILGDLEIIGLLRV